MDRVKNEILASHCFHKLKLKYKHFEKFVEEKIVPVSSDLTLPGLGLNEEDRLMLVSNVTIIINVAASTSFHDPI